MAMVMSTLPNMPLICIQQIQTTPWAHLHGFFVIKRNCIRTPQGRYLNMLDRHLYMRRSWMENNHPWIHCQNPLMSMWLHKNDPPLCGSNLTTTPKTIQTDLCLPIGLYQLQMAFSRRCLYLFYWWATCTMIFMHLLDGEA